MQEFYYRQVEDGTFCVTGYVGDEAEVVIPDEHVVTMLYDKLFRGHPEITSVRIPDTVTDMGEFLFDGCVNLRHLKLPAELRVLWGYTFARCGIEEAYLPEGLRRLPPFAFKDCKNLRKVVCGSGMEKIHAWAFSGCDRMSQEGLTCGPGTEVSPQAFETKVLNT